MRRTIIRSLTATAVAAALLGSAGATSALAHVQVVSTNPKAGATVKNTLRSVTVRYSGPIRSGSLSVVNAHGRPASSGGGGRDPRNIKRLLVGLKSGLGAGSYTARWSTVAADGHHQHGSFSFKLKK